MSKKHEGSTVDTKMRRLCRAAERVVISVLAEQEALTGCILLDVIPVSTNRLIARVGLPKRISIAEFDTCTAAISITKARCRAELAVSINRKRTPVIEFELFPHGFAEEKREPRSLDARLGRQESAGILDSSIDEEKTMVTNSPTSAE